MALDYTIIPFYVKILHVDKSLDLRLKRPDADFSTLPFLEKNYTENSENPFLGMTVTPSYDGTDSIPQYGNLLHFALPEIFTRPFQDTGLYPPTPNRWLVTRKARTDGTAQKRWLIASDYVTDDISSDANLQSNIFIPYSNKTLYDNENPIDRENRGIFFKKDNYKSFQPFRYIGLKKNVSATQDLGKLDELLNNGIPIKPENNWNFYYDEPLNALGYGHPHFASSYTNCRTVFGLRDKNGLADDQYEIHGWWENIDSQNWDDMAWKRYGQYLKNNLPFEGFQPQSWLDSQPNAMIDQLLSQGINKTGSPKLPFNYILNFNTSYFNDLKAQKSDIYGGLPTDSINKATDIKTQLDNQKYTVTLANSSVEGISSFLAQELADDNDVYDISKIINTFLGKLNKLSTAFSKGTNSANIEKFNLLIGKKTTEKLVRIVKARMSPSQKTGNYPEQLNYFISKLNEINANADKKSEIKKILIEDLLEALQLGFLDREQLDISARFEQARHLKGFSKEAGKMQFEIAYDFKSQGNSGTKSEITSNQAYQIIIQRPEINQQLLKVSNTLNLLNKKKQEIDKDIDQIRSEQLELFTFWNKYQMFRMDKAETRFIPNKYGLQIRRANHQELVDDNFYNTFIHMFAKMQKTHQLAYATPHRFNQLLQLNTTPDGITKWQKQFIERYDSIHTSTTRFKLLSSTKQQLEELKKALEEQSKIFTTLEAKEFSTIIYGDGTVPGINAVIELFFGSGSPQAKQNFEGTISPSQKGKTGTIVPATNIQTIVGNIDNAIQALTGTDEEATYQSIQTNVKNARTEYSDILNITILNEIFEPLEKNTNQLHEQLIRSR